MKTITPILFCSFLITALLYSDSLYNRHKLLNENLTLKNLVNKCDSINTINIFKVDSFKKANITYSILFNNLLETHRKSKNGKIYKGE